jgi:CRISPR/Cas system type I-B associated protein Csh2 (Cas7 group RAMP superfamily)
MLATLKMLKEKFGGADQYMVEKCGLTKEDVEKIRSNLIAEQPAVNHKVQYSL